MRSSSVFIATYVQYIDLKNAYLSDDVANVYCKKFCMPAPIAFVQVQVHDKPNSASDQTCAQY
jgi:hypothetical protein